MKKKPNGFVVALRLILPMCMAIGIQLAVVMVFEIILGVYIAANNLSLLEVAMANGDQQAYMDAILDAYVAIMQKPLVNDLLTLGTMLTLAIAFGLWYFKGEFAKQPVPVSKALPARNIVIILLSGILGQICISMMLVIILPLFPRIAAQYELLMESLVGGNSIIAIISTVLLAPFAEELIFRGLTLGTARKFMPYMAAISLQALFFGIYHMNIVQGVYAFLMGLVFGYVAYRLNNIFASMLFHAAINGSSFLLAYIIPEALYYNTLGMVLVALITGLALLSLLYLLKIPQVAKPAAPIVNSPVGNPTAENNIM